MTVNQTWVNPATAIGSGGLDVATGDTITETYLDALASDLDHIAGTSGFTAAPGATHGIEPASGYFMGANGANQHVEGGSGTCPTAGGSVTFANAFAAAPVVVACVNSSTATQDSIVIYSVTTTGFSWKIGTADRAAYWIAVGSD